MAGTEPRAFGVATTVDGDAGHAGHAGGPVHRDLGAGGPVHRDSGAGVPTSPARLRDRWRLEWSPGRAAVAVALLQVVAVVAVASGGGWMKDDFQNLSQAQTSRLTGEYLFRPIFGHPLPGTRLVDWVLMRVAPMNYLVAMTVLAAGIGMSGWLVYRFVSLMQERPSYTAVGFASLAGFTGVWMAPTIWFAGGVQVVATGLSGAVIAVAALRCARSPRLLGRFGWALWALLWTGFGLAFYERAAISSLAAVAVAVLAAARTPSPRSMIRALRAVWPLALTVVAGVVAYLAVYLSGNFVNQTGSFRLATLVRFWLISWSSFVSGLLGGPLRWRWSGFYGVSGAPWAWEVIAQLVALIVLVAGVRRTGARAFLAWVVFVVVFAAAEYSVATARLTETGLGIGHEFRYLADLVPLAVLFLAVSLVGGARPGRAVRHATPRTRAASRWPLLVPVVVFVLFCVSAVPLARRWSTNPAPAYERNLSQTLHAADRRGDYALWNTRVPVTIAPSWMVPFNTAQYFARLEVGHPVPINDPSRRMLLVDPSGRVQDSHLAVDVALPDVCSVRAHQSVVLTLGIVDASQRFVRYSYRGPAGSHLSMAIDPAGRFIDATGHYEVDSTAGSGQYIVGLQPKSILRFRIMFSAPGICLTNVELGHPAVG